MIRALLQRRFSLPSAVSFILQNWVLILAAVTSGGLLLWPMIGKAGGGAVTTAEAVRLINREKAVLLDVCEPAEFAAGHAAGARNVPLGSLQGAKDLPSNKALPVVLLCASGAAGGNAAWRDANLPMAKNA